MPNLLKQFINDQTIQLSSGEHHKVTDGVSPDEGLYLQYLIKSIKPKIAIEVGLGSGISSLFILEAIKKYGGKTLIGMDPSQFDKHKDTNTKTHGNVYKGIGLYTVNASRYNKLYKFYNNTSQQILPRLVDKNVQVNFAFIDGWHTFDHTLVDFFYIDQLLTIGGIVVLHDISFPSIDALCKFIVLNRNYEKLQIPKQYNIQNIAAFKKLSKDNRNWDHFVRFWETPGLIATLHTIPSLLKNSLQKKFAVYFATFNNLCT